MHHPLPSTAMVKKPSVVWLDNSIDELQANASGPVSGLICAPKAVERLPNRNVAIG